MGVIESLDLPVSAIMLLLAAAMLAGFVDTLAGGGGLITIPTLMISGIPPIYALGTNKLQAVVGSGTASLIMFKRKKVAFSRVKIMMCSAFTGGLLGAIVVQFFDTEVLNILVPLVIVLIAIYFVFSPAYALEQREVRLQTGAYSASAVPAIGFYGGMFGPGTGSFLVLGGVALRGQDIVTATAVAKTLNFATNVASLMVFVAFGKVLWVVGGLMMVGQAIGANLGARTLLSIDPRWLRYMVILVCMVMLGYWFLS